MIKRKKSKPTPSANTKRDAILEAWDKYGIVVEPLHLKIAPEIFVTVEDTTLSDGTVVRRGSSYFNWGTAKALSDEGKLGAGWRLPTEEEMEAISRYVFGVELPKRGYISPNDMIAYPYMPDATIYKALNAGQGYIWTSSIENEMYAYYAEITARNIVRAGASIYRSFGLSILCVKDV